MMAQIFTLSHYRPFCSRRCDLNGACAATLRQPQQACTQRHQRLHVAANAREESNDDTGPKEFLEDLTRDFGVGDEEKWKQRRAEERTSWREGLSFKPESIGEAREGSFSDKIKDGVDKALIADFFFVIFSLVVLVVGVALKSTLSFTLVLDYWLAGWPTLIQPAIGVLMAGSLLSGLLGWLKSDIIRGS